MDSVLSMIRLIVLVIKHLEATVRNEHLRYADTLRCLVVLKNRGNDTRQSECGAVERMAELDLLAVSTAETAVQTVSLIALEVTR